jgi:hypothetical protein
MVSDISQSQSQTSRVDIAVTPEKQGAEDGLCKEIKNAVEDGLGIGGDDVGTLTNAPGNGVYAPKDESECAAAEECASNITANVVGMDTGFPGELVDYVQESSTTKGKVTPLVGGLDQGADKTSDDHNQVDKDYPHDGGPWHTSSEQKIHEQKRGSDDPVNVTHVEDLTVYSGDSRVATSELNIDGGPAQIGCHAKVSNGCDHGDAAGDVVEDAVGAWLGEGVADECDCCNSHDCANGPIPIRSTDGDVNVRTPAVHDMAIDVQCLIASHVEEKRCYYMDLMLRRKGSIWARY